MTDTPLDVAAQNMTHAPDDTVAMLTFYGQLASQELFLLLDSEPVGDTIAPRLFETSEGKFVLVFDTEDRLTAFADGPAPYAALSGRRIAEMLANQDIGLGLNLGDTPSSQLLPATVIAWLAETMRAEPTEASALPVALHAPHDIPESILVSLDRHLAKAAGLATVAYLATATYKDGNRGLLLALIDPILGAEPALARAVQNAVSFSGLDAAAIDVTFLPASNPTTAQLAKVGFRIDLPKPLAPPTPSAPGMDPTKPPKLT